MNNHGFNTIIGLDEAGRGSLAGPVTAAAVILPLNFDTSVLNDSKKLTEKKRLKAFNLIMANALVGVGWVDERTIDLINILQASLLAMRRAYSQLSFYPASQAYTDGNKKAGLPMAEEAIVGGDGKIFEIMAASIVAKTLRDNYMINLNLKYPHYGLAQHKGYPTKQHKKAIEIYGHSAVHRLSFKLT